MHCCQCNNDLARCVCPDLAERVEKIAEFVHLGPEYRARIDANAREQARKREEEQSREE